MDAFPPEWFRREDEAPDAAFYAAPRFVTHLDDGAIAAVTALYRELLPAGGAILDLMSSWISHLPAEIPYARVAGLGMNEEELSANPRLTERVIQDLNEQPALPFPDASFDGAVICASIDYLVRPVEVLRDLGRALRPGAPLVITFSNRCFPMKVIEIWKHLTAGDRQQLVQMLLSAAGNWTELRAVTPIAEGLATDPLHAVTARSLGPPHRRDHG